MLYQHTHARSADAVRLDICPLFQRTRIGSINAVRSDMRYANVHTQLRSDDAQQGRWVGLREKVCIRVVGLPCCYVRFEGQSYHHE